MDDRIDEIVQTFIKMCSIEQHLRYQRSDTEGDRITYYPFIDNEFMVDASYRSKKCSEDATKYLVENIPVK